MTLAHRALILDQISQLFVPIRTDHQQIEAHNPNVFKIAAVRYV